MAMAGLAIERQKKLLDWMRENGGIVISEAARAIGVSEMTIRRDLACLESEGLANRVHGGALPSGSIRFGERLAANAPAKTRAAAKLADMLPEDGAIYLDGSTTMLSLIPRLRHAHELQVATNNIETFRELSRIESVRPLLIGGRLDRRTDNLVGALAMRSILAIAFDAAFFSAYGITPEHGPMEATVEDAEVKDLVASRSGHVYLAVDHSKLGVVVSGAWQPDRARTTLAPDRAPQDYRLRPDRLRLATII